MREAEHVSDACHGLSLVTPRSYVSGPVPRLERHYWCQKTSELACFFFFLLLEKRQERHEKRGNNSRAQLEKIRSDEKRILEVK